MMTCPTRMWPFLLNRSVGYESTRREGKTEKHAGDIARLVDRGDAIHDETCRLLVTCKPVIAAYISQCQTDTPYESSVSRELLDDAFENNTR